MRALSRIAIFAHPEAVYPGHYRGTTAAACICDPPVQPVDVGAPDHVVGDGSPASCDEAALAAAVAQGRRGHLRLRPCSAPTSTAAAVRSSTAAGA